MFFLIMILLAFSTPLFVGRAYQTGRAWGALVGASWLLLSLFLAGMNFATAWNLAITHPLYSVVVLGAVSLGFFFAGPGSALWRRAGRAGPVRLVAFRLRRRFYRHGYSRQWTGDVAAMALALLILAPVSLLTLRPDPAYEYAMGKLQRELTRRLPDVARLADAATAETLDRHKATPGTIDAQAAAAAQRAIADGAKRVQGLLGDLKAPRERIDAARSEVAKIAQAADTNLRAEAVRASRSAMADVGKRILDEERSGLVEAIRRTIEAAVSEAIKRARLATASTAVEDLRSTTERLIEAAVGEVAKAAGDVAVSEAQRLLEQRSAEIDAAARQAARGSAEGIARRANAAMMMIEDQLKRALAAEEARVEADRIQLAALAKTRADAWSRFEILPRTRFEGGFGPPYQVVDTVEDCAVLCLAIGCRGFSVFTLTGTHACHRYTGGRLVPVPEERYTGGRLR